MAQKFYNVEKAAELLGVTPDEINQMRERQELHGYRDGTDWKFKAEEVEQLAQQAAPPTDEQSDVLLSEVELGQSDIGSSGTVIGPPPVGEGEPKESGVDSAVTGFENLDMALEDSQADMALEPSTPAGSPPADSTVELSGEALEDDDLVLGGSDAKSGSGSGSDITIGGDSGISLVDPTDSGLSLEEPLDLAGGSEGSLALGDSDLLSLGESSSNALSDLGADSDFLLTPADDSGAGEDSESASQVIALDGEKPADAAVVSDLGGMSDIGGISDLGAMSDVSMPPMLDADLSAELTPAETSPLEAAGAVAAPLAGAPQDYAAAGPVATAMPSAALPEAPYSIWNILSLAGCTLILVFIGMMMCDLMRNMWSWDGALPVNSTLMDWILGR
jgi:excisionase family DNA binding protein